MRLPKISAFHWVATVLMGVLETANAASPTLSNSASLLFRLKIDHLSFHAGVVDTGVNGIVEAIASVVLRTKSRVPRGVRSSGDIRDR